jgi:ribosomal protein L40E
VCARTEFGSICDNCRAKDPATHEKCLKCGQVKRVNGRDKSGLAICPACNRKNKS